MTVLVDSDILIEVGRARSMEILAQWARLADSDDVVLYSPVTAAELWAGVRPREAAALSRLLDSLLCVAIDAEIGRQAGDYLRIYNKSHGLELGDALIAASAVRNRASLWTRNRKHYPMKELTFYSAPA